MRRILSNADASTPYHHDSRNGKNHHDDSEQQSVGSSVATPITNNMSSAVTALHAVFDNESMLSTTSASIAASTVLHNSSSKILPPQQQQRHLWEKSNTEPSHQIEVSTAEEMSQRTNTTLHQEKMELGANDEEYDHVRNIESSDPNKSIHYSCGDNSNIHKKIQDTTDKEGSNHVQREIFLQNFADSFCQDDHHDTEETNDSNASRGGSAEVEGLDANTTIAKRNAISRYIAAGTYPHLQSAGAIPKQLAQTEFTVGVRKKPSLWRRNQDENKKLEDAPLEYADTPELAHPRDDPLLPSRQSRFGKLEVEGCSLQVPPGAYAMMGEMAEERSAFANLLLLQENQEQATYSFDRSRHSNTVMDNITSPDTVQSIQINQSSNGTDEGQSTTVARTRLQIWNNSSRLPTQVVDSEEDDDISIEEMDSNKTHAKGVCATRQLTIIVSFTCLVIGVVMGSMIGLFLPQRQTIDPSIINIDKNTIIVADSWIHLVDYCDAVEPKSIKFPEDFQERLHALQLQLSFTVGSEICTPRRMAMRSLVFLNYTFDNLLPYVQLSTLFFATKGQDWKNNQNWLSQRGTFCGWYGVHCSNDEVATGPFKLQLDDNGLHGSLPMDIFFMQTLEHLSFANNPGLSGTVPTQIGLLSEQLRYLDLDRTAVSGTIPSELSVLSHLQTLRLASKSIVGPLPDFQMLTQLKSLELVVDIYREKIPDGFSKLTNLHTLKVHGIYIGHFPENLFFNLRYLDIDGGGGSLLGTLPREAFVRNRNLKFLKITNNLFYGSIPTTIGNLQQLEQLVLSSNGFDHTIPTELGLCTSLKEIHLNWNELEGTLPTELGGLTNVEYINIQSNRLVGSIPSELGQMTKLRGFILSSQFQHPTKDMDNIMGFSGTMPHAICNISSLQTVEMVLCNSYLMKTCPEECCSCSHFPFE